MYDCQTGVNCNVPHGAGFDCQMSKEVSCLFLTNNINFQIAWQPFCNYSGGSHEWTPLSREKGVFN